VGGTAAGGVVAGGLVAGDLVVRDTDAGDLAAGVLVGVFDDLVPGDSNAAGSVAEAGSPPAWGTVESVGLFESVGSLAAGLALAREKGLRSHFEKPEGLFSAPLANPLPGAKLAARKRLKIVRRIAGFLP
jgi:hypothetical protein